MTTKTTLFGVLATMVILSVTGMNYVFAEMPTEEQYKLQDELGNALHALQYQNEELRKASGNTFIQEIITDNEAKITMLQEQFENAIPKRQLAYVSPTDEAKMTSAMWKLADSGLPFLGMGINPETGILDVQVNSEKTTNIDDKIRQIVGNDIRVNITYGVDTATFQGSCPSQAGKCTTIIGASFGQDASIGLDCTISIAATKGSGASLVNGVVIPHHCNPNHADYYQYNINDSTHLVGPHNTDGDGIVIVTLQK